MSVDQNEIRFVQLYSPISNQKVSVDFSSECRHEDPIVASINVVIASYHEVFVSINWISTACNHVVILGKRVTHLLKINFGQLDSFVDCGFVLKESTKILEKILEFLDG